MSINSKQYELSLRYWPLWANSRLLTPHVFVLWVSYRIWRLRVLSRAVLSHPFCRYATKLPTSVHPY